jgi:hypothetical protein
MSYASALAERKKLADSIQTLRWDFAEPQTEEFTGPASTLLPRF